MSGETELAKVAFTVGTVEASTIYMAVPAGQYTGAQTLVYKCGAKEVSRTLSASKATFTPGQTFSKQVDFDDVIRLDGRNSDYTASDGDALNGTLYNESIIIPDGATVTFRGIDSGVVCQGDATIILADGTTNTVNPDGDSGLYVPEGKTLTIQGTGSLNVSGTNYAAGIGGGYGGSCGFITISGGSVTATAGGLAPYSIGKGKDSNSQLSFCLGITIGGVGYGDGIIDALFTWTAP